jgi:FtsP/CotA-like multicopper oxidase with cupredoxin domain
LTTAVRRPIHPKKPLSYFALSDGKPVATIPKALVSRRRFLAGAAAACFGSRLHAETTSDGVQVLHALTGAAATSSEKKDPALWGYDGTVPGPTLRVKRGEELRLRLVNDLAEPTTIHWHGVRLPNAMDGVPLLTQLPVAPGTSFDYRFQPPDAGTFWYHAHAGRQIDQGLHGALIVEETEAIAVDRDIVLVLEMPVEPGNPQIRVNGSIRPDIPVKTGERLRLRLINASSAGGLFVKLEDHAAWVMAIDGQPAEPFLARDSRIGLGPGNRADLFVDTDRNAGTAAAIRAGAGDEHPIARLVYESGGDVHAARRPQPHPLPPNPLPSRIDLKGSLRAEMALGNLKPREPVGPPLFTVARGRAVTLAMRNPSGQPQAVHVHGHSFRLLDRLDDGWKPYWMDTVVVGEQTERIAFVAAIPGKWLIECRVLERRDTDTAVWFAVT